MELVSTATAKFLRSIEDIRAEEAHLLYMSTNSDKITDEDLEKAATLAKSADIAREMWHAVFKILEHQFLRSVPTYSGGIRITLKTETIPD